MPVDNPIANQSQIIAGVDEAGRGPLAGPVTAACVVLPENFSLEGLGDSKKLSERTREKLYPQIITRAVAYSIVSVGARRIDQINIREASLLAMRLAIIRVSNQLLKSVNPQQLLVLVDGNTNPGTKFREQSIIKGDQKVGVISAASILAKVTRDRLMKRASTYYPNYGLEIHKGYPTKAHIEAIKSYGPTKLHRRSFAPLKKQRAAQ